MNISYIWSKESGSENGGKYQYNLDEKRQNIRIIKAAENPLPGKKE